MTDASAPDRPLDRLGDYEVLAPIAEGGMASVYLARPVGRATELVALKVIRAEHARNNDFVAMLVDEAAIASRLAHPNILPIRGLEHAGSRYFLVMDLLRGHTLLKVWQAAHARGQRLPLEVTAWIGARVADALHHAHETPDAAGAPLQVVHRDVNPANIFVTSEGVPKLIDFGLAKARDRIAQTAMGVVKGKLAYLAPEQVQGRPADRRSDVFALGVTLWELTTDQRLFHEDDDVQTIRRVREGHVPDPATIVEAYPRALADAVLKACAREPEERWQTAAELRDALDAAVRGMGGTTGAAAVRAAVTPLFVGEAREPWEAIADEVAAEQQRTRVWRPEMARTVEDATKVTWTTVAWTAGAVCGATAMVLLAVLAFGALVRACKRPDETSALEQRVTRIEDVLGLGEAGAAAPATADEDPVVSAFERRGACAVAKIAAYRAWQEALDRAKPNAAIAQARCADIWSESRKQACYYAATSQVRATQAARDAAVAGGATAREAEAAVKDDAKNPAVARAHAASEAAYAACGDDGGM